MHIPASRTLLWFAVIVLLVPSTACRAQGWAGPLESITEAELRDHIHYLASDFLEGRDTGTKGQAPDDGWNDYEGLDVSGKIAVTVSGAPTRNDEPVLPEEQHRIYSSLPRSANARIMSAVEHGVSALIVVVGSGSTSIWDEVAARMDRPSMRPLPTGAPGQSSPRSHPWIVLIKAQEAAHLLSRTGYDPVSGTGPCSPGTLDGVRIALDLRHDVAPAYSAPNVVALLAGTDSVLKDEYIVVTAHLDHLGIRNGQVLITRGFMGPNYHQPSDDPETINYPKVTQAARLAYALALEAANREQLFERD